ncbi:MAG: hypothetical protein PHC95_06020 [Parabacteroides sp.]|nr:hypothetical protein [Parabacteroides sp.]
MVLYYRISLSSFVESLEKTSGPDSFFTIPAKGLMHIVPQEEVEYGLSLLRESIGLYEERKGIPMEKSKKAMPFFRQDSRMLVGPEIGMYVISLYEKPGEPSEPARSAEPSLVLELDYQSLGELCLFENYSLLSCKYEKEPILNHFTTQLEKEYDTFFFNEEHTGFTPDSRFFSMLCNACLEVRHPSSMGDKEWRLALLRSPEEASYRYEPGGSLIPYVPVSLPAECLRRVHLEAFQRQPLLFGTLNGFLKSKGLPAEQLLNLS